MGVRLAAEVVGAGAVSLVDYFDPHVKKQQKIPGKWKLSDWNWRLGREKNLQQKNTGKTWFEDQARSLVKQELMAIAWIRFEPF